MRVVYGEVATISGGGNDDETDAMASVLYNRIGARGFRGGVQATFRGVAYAPVQFESVTTLGHTNKFDHSGPDQYQNLPEAECDELKRGVAAIQRLMQSGPRYGYFYNLGGNKGSGDVIGGSRFFITRKF